MPGDLIRQFTSQADWQSGTSEGLDLTSRPGDVLLTADYIKQYLADADWNTGAKANVTVASNRVALTQTQIEGYVEVSRGQTYSESSHYGDYDVADAFDGDLAAASRWQGLGTTDQWIAVDFGGSPKVVTQLRIWGYNGSNSAKNFRLEASNNGSDWTVLVTGLLTRVVEWQEWAFENSTAYRYYRIFCVDNHGGTGYTIINEAQLCVYQPSAYASSGTWLSPWLAHGKGTSPASSWLSWVLDSLPSGSSVVAHVRWSPDNGSTYSAWAAATNGAPLPGTPQAYVQIRLTLTATADKTDTPVVSGLTVIVGALHRWTSPAIDIHGIAGDTLMVSLPPTNLTIQVEIMPGEEQLAFLGPAQPSAWTEDWRGIGCMFDNPRWTSIAIRLTLRRAGVTDDYLSELSLYEAVVLHMLDEPTPSIRPPAVTDVICYVEDSEPLVEVTAALVGVPADKKVEVRISVPAGSSQSYAQSYANAYLAVHGAEKRSLTCRVPICTRIGFRELILIAYPPWGHTNANPWQAMVQEIFHRPLASPPKTELVLGDYQPDDTEALVQLIARGG